MSTNDGKKSQTKGAKAARGPVVSQPLLPEPEEARGADDLASVQDLFLAILAEIDLDLDEAYLRDLAELRARICEATGLNRLMSLEGELRRLVARFARQTLDERSQSASFVAMIVERLTEVEKYLLASVGQTVQAHKDRDAFATDMINGLDAVGSSVRASKELDNLKGLVLGKLDSFKSSLQTQREAERQQMRQMKARVEDLNKNLCEAKEQMASLEQEKLSLAKKVQVDPLTGIMNRRALDESLENELLRFQRYQNCFSLILIDLDHFKAVNDTHGHAGGDVCLKEVVHALSGNLREVDLLTRYGGEEFVVLLPETGRNQARTVAEKLREILEAREIVFEGRQIPLTASFGVTEVRTDDTSTAEILDRADKAMYEAKTRGRNRVVIN